MNFINLTNQSGESVSINLDQVIDFTEKRYNGTHVRYISNEFIHVIESHSAIMEKIKKLNNKGD